jgi:hypothetical protein
MTQDIITIQADAPDGTKHTLTATPKTFKSGREGYFATGKLDINGAKHQVSLIFTRIDKTKTPPTETTAPTTEGS